MSARGLGGGRAIGAAEPLLGLGAALLDLLCLFLGDFHRLPGLAIVLLPAVVGPPVDLAVAAGVEIAAVGAARQRQALALARLDVRDGALLTSRGLGRQGLVAPGDLGLPRDNVTLLAALDDAGRAF